jgi:hypothetical protein
MGQFKLIPLAKEPLTVTGRDSADMRLAEAKMARQAAKAVCWGDICTLLRCKNLRMTLAKIVFDNLVGISFKTPALGKGSRVIGQWGECGKWQGGV